MAIASSSDNSGPKDEFPCYYCGKLGHWRSECPDRKHKDDEKDTKSSNGVKIVNDSGNKGDKTKSKKKKPKPPNQANLTVAESADLYFTECNYDVMMLQIFRNRVDHKVPKGSFVYDTGADVNACNDFK